MSESSSKCAALDSPHPAPPSRRLQIFSFDPSVDVDLKSAGVSRSVVNVRWEPVRAGPIGEYVEVVDIDPSSGCAYDPVNLSDEHLLARDGLAPSTGNPQFHQQMAYAVVMKTLENFEQALGRPVFWAERSRNPAGGYFDEPQQRYVQRLRVYPHALREENAYYSPAKRALLFGYFNARTTDPREELPGGVVFTCLSHHIVAHETTHAILDGMYPRLLEATNHDMLAFHEAFGDLIAIFQTFTLPGVLLHQIQATRGDLRGTNHLLVRLATQFARATGRGGALRDALGPRQGDGSPVAPDPDVLARTLEPHARGAILVAAVFDAFLQMYENRTVDLRRIATGGTGELPRGDIHPDLAQRFAQEASRLSQRVLTICIRALDYLPPVDVTFGDFLRALITSDADFFPDDPRRYRLAFLDAFRSRGIFPADVRALGEDTLRWYPVDAATQAVLQQFMPPVPVLRSMAYSYDSDAALETICDRFNERVFQESKQEGLFKEMAAEFINMCWATSACESNDKDNGLGRRFARYRASQCFAQFLALWLVGQISNTPLDSEDAADLEKTLGLDFEAIQLAMQRANSADVRPRRFSGLEVHTVRPTVRLLADGRTKVELLVILTQKRSVLLPYADGPLEDLKEGTREGDGLPFKLRGGCTLIIDPESGQVRYAIRKSLSSKTRRARQADFLRGQVERFGPDAIERFRLGKDRPAEGKPTNLNEPAKEIFCLLHLGDEDGGADYA